MAIQASGGYMSAAETRPPTITTSTEAISLRVTEARSSGRAASALAAARSAPTTDGQSSGSALAARPDDLASVTRSEIVSVLVVMIGGLVSAALTYPPLAWMAVVPALLLPLDAAVGRRAVAQPS